MQPFCTLFNALMCKQQSRLCEKNAEKREPLFVLTNNAALPKLLKSSSEINCQTFLSIHSLPVFVAKEAMAFLNHTI